VQGFGAQGTCGSGNAFGVAGDASGGAFAIGVQGVGRNGSTASVGVYGAVPPSGCGTAQDYAGYFVGDFFMSSSGAYLPSDAKLKHDVKPLTAERAHEILKNLDPKTYEYNREQYPSLNLSSGEQYGLLAENVEKVLPNAVKETVNPPEVDSLGNTVYGAVEFKAVNYTPLITVLVEAVRDLKASNDELQRSNAEMKSAMTALQDCCRSDGDGGETGSNSDFVELNNYAIILDQNSPNPFAEKTTITYTIPGDVKDAQLIFSDDNGRVLKTVQITERGQGSMLIYASNLSSGIYTYSLIADGKLIDTKKMVCLK
jgi:hypothetical protein